MPYGANSTTFGVVVENSNKSPSSNFPEKNNSKIINIRKAS
jgi:hypothetical protein